APTPSSSRPRAILAYTGSRLPAASVGIRSHPSRRPCSDLNERTAPSLVSQPRHNRIRRAAGPVPRGSAFGHSPRWTAMTVRQRPTERPLRRGTGGGEKPPHAAATPPPARTTPLAQDSPHLPPG